MVPSIRDSLQFGRGCPRPQLQRTAWTSLDGAWEFAIDFDAAWSAPGAVPFSSTIKVPFSPETALSGVGETGFFRACCRSRGTKRPDSSVRPRLRSIWPQESRSCPRPSATSYAHQGLARIADTVSDFAAAVEAALVEDPIERLRAADAFLTHLSWDGTWTRMKQLIEQAVERRRDRPIHEALSAS